MFLGLGCGCLLAMGIGLAPRLFLILAWIFSARGSQDQTRPIAFVEPQAACENVVFDFDSPSMTDATT